MMERYKSSHVQTLITKGGIGEVQQIEEFVVISGSECYPFLF